MKQRTAPSHVDPTRIKVFNLDDPSEIIEVTGPVDDFFRDQLSEDELDRLFDQGFVVVGGGAAPMYSIRFALPSFCKCSSLNINEVDSHAKCLVCSQTVAGWPVDLDEQERATMTAYYAEKERERRS
jgi:hypothetical protein